MKRNIVLFILLCLCLVFQGTLFQYLSIGGIKPDLVMLLVIYIALHQKPLAGLIYGFAYGLIIDMYMGRYIGLHAIILAVVALLVSYIQQKWYRENVILTMMLVFFLTFLGQLLLVVMAVTSGLQWSARNPFDTMMGISFYNCLLVPFTYPLIHRSFTKGILKASREYEQQQW
ncbi:MAG: rod shape-determining protein MreD [Peptococcaceae bacterium]|nr:rod shape-determining protein MreD [Peptococcaceae bacterium]